MKMERIKNPNGEEWTEKETKLIDELKNPKKMPTKKEAMKVWDDGLKNIIRGFYNDFGSYWEELKKVTGPKPLRCENCKLYPCPEIKRIFKDFKEIIICWIFHGNMCHKFVKK